MTFEFHLVPYKLQQLPFMHAQKFVARWVLFDNKNSWGGCRNVFGR